MFVKVRMASLVGSALVALSSVASAQQATVRPTDNYDELFQRYLLEARTARPAPQAQAWSWMNGIALDHRARSVNDLVTIRVVESITGSGTADSALGKNSNAGVG